MRRETCAFFARDHRDPSPSGDEPTRSPDRGYGDVGELACRSEGVLYEVGQIDHSPLCGCGQIPGEATMLEPAIRKRCGRRVLRCDLVFERNGSAGQTVHDPLIVGARGTYEGERDGSRASSQQTTAQSRLLSRLGRIFLRKALSHSFRPWKTLCRSAAPVISRVRTCISWYGQLRSQRSRPAWASLMLVWRKRVVEQTFHCQAEATGRRSAPVTASECFHFLLHRPGSQSL